AHGHGVEHLAVAPRLRVGVHGHELVGAVAESLDAQGPDIDVVLLALDELGDVRRVTGFIGAGGAGEGADDAEAESGHNTGAERLTHQHDEPPWAAAGYWRPRAGSSSVGAGGPAYAFCESRARADVGGAEAR